MISDFLALLMNVVNLNTVQEVIKQLMPLFVLLISLATIGSVSSQSVIYPPSSSYFYNFTTTFEQSSFLENDDMYQEIALPFPIMFPNTPYMNLYVSSNSYITFGAGYANYSRLQLLPSPKILIRAKDYRITLLRAFKTDTNFTIQYEGQLLQTKSETLGWYVTFYKVSYQRFDIHIYKNDLRSGESFLCTSLNCYQSLDPELLVTYIQCLPHSCFEVSSGDCQQIILSSCEKCSGTIPLTASNCEECTTAFEMINSTCSHCSQNYTSWNDTCVEVSSRCEASDASNPSVCSQCETGFTGSTCIQCQPGYYADAYNCLSCLIKGCQKCESAQTCIECQSGYVLKSFQGDYKCEILAVDNLLTLAIIVSSVVVAMAIIAGAIIWRCMVSYDKQIKRRNVEHIHLQQLKSGLKPENDSIELICSICLEESCTIMTQCMHPFHQQCLLLWIGKDMHCPNCKRKIERIFKSCRHCKRFNILVPIRLGSHQAEYCCECKKNTKLAASDESILPLQK